MVDVYSPKYLFTSDDSPVQFGSIYAVKQYLKKERPPNLAQRLRDVDEYVKNVDFGTHQGVAHRKEGEFSYTLYPHRDEFFECDLMDVYGKRGVEVAAKNKGYVFLLLVINAQTKMLYFRPLRGKSGVEVAKALREIFVDDVKPVVKGFEEILLHCDHGKEFYNAHVDAVTRQLGIHLYSNQSDHKAAVAERVIRTIRSRLVRAIEVKGTEAWITLIARIVNLYNNAFHRSIKMTPFEAQTRFPEALFKLAESRERENAAFTRGTQKVQLGDTVRLKVQNTNWRKGSLRTFTARVYTISAVYKTRYKWLYGVSDGGGRVAGRFDEHMLKQAAAERRHRLHILARRTRRGHRQVRVHWDGYGDSDDEWINAEEVENVQEE